MPHNGNDGGSYIEPTSTEEQGNQVAVHLIPEACQTEAGISVGGPSVNINERGSRQYIGVTRISSKWRARVSNKRKPNGKENRVHLGMFPTAEMAAIAFDSAFLFLKGDSPANSLNFQEYSAHIKSILQICSPSQIAKNIKSVAWKAAETIAPLIGVENKGRELEVSNLIEQEPKEVSPAMWTTNISTASASLMSSNIDPYQKNWAFDYANGDLYKWNLPWRILAQEFDLEQLPYDGEGLSLNEAMKRKGMPHSIPNADFPVVRPAQVKQCIKVAARAAGRARAPQVRRKIYDDKQETQTVKQTKQHIQYEQAINDSGICSFSVVQEPEHEYSTPVDTAKDNVNNQKIQDGQSSCNMLGGKPNMLGGAADSAISSFSLAYEPLHESSIQQPFPISNRNCMPTRVQSFDELIDVPKFSISNRNCMPTRVQSFDELIDVSKEHYMP